MERREEAVTKNVPERLAEDLSAYVSSRIGMSFPRERWEELTEKVGRAAKSRGFGSVVECIEWLLSSPFGKSRLDLISGCLTVGETFFFREANTLTALSELAFPEILRAHEGGEHRVRIWSAGCATGEEPYSVAMLANEYPGFRGWSVSILGTDINPVFLRKAETGLFSEWSFRGVDARIREKFFRKSEGNLYELLPSIRAMVTFSRLNLVEDAYPALLNGTNSLDLVLCRNVLIYLGADHARRVALKLHQCLLPHGWLALSPVEAALAPRGEFTQVFHSGAILCRKASELAEPAEATTPAPAGVTQGTRARRAPVQTRSRPPATYRRAQELCARADYPGAIEVLQELLNRSGVDAAALLLLARSYANRGMFPQAEQWCARAVAAEPQAAPCRYLHGLILVEQNRVSEAVSALRKAIYLDPDFAVAHVALAHLYRRAGKRALSSRCFRNALLSLRKFPADCEPPEAEGMTAGALSAMIAAEGADWRNDGQ